MSKIISIHSFRGGTGKSGLSANLAVYLSIKGKKAAIIDADIQSPGAHVLFKFKKDDIRNSLNDYLWGKCGIGETAYDVTPRTSNGGKVYLIPSSIEPGEITRILREGYNVGLLHDGIKDLISTLSLDYLIIDTHPGLNEETLVAIAVSDLLLILLRPDNQDYQGTAVTLEIAKKLKTPRALCVNQVLDTLNIEKLKRQIEEIFKSDVIALLLHSKELMELASAEIMYLKFPEHNYSYGIEAIAERIMQI